MMHIAKTNYPLNAHSTAVPDFGKIPMKKEPS